MRATLPSSRYPSTTSFVPSYNPLNLLVLISCPLVSQRCFPHILLTRELSSCYLAVFSPTLIFIPRRRRAGHATFDSHSTTPCFILSNGYVRFSPFLKAAFLPHVPTHMNNYFARQKSSLAVLSSARVLFCYLTLRACRVKVEKNASRMMTQCCNIKTFILLISENLNYRIIRVQTNNAIHKKSHKKFFLRAS